MSPSFLLAACPMNPRLDQSIVSAAVGQRSPGHSPPHSRDERCQPLVESAADSRRAAQARDRRFKKLPVAASLSMRLVQTNSRHSLSQLTHETAWSFLFFIISIRSPNALEHWRHARPILPHQFRIYCARDDRHCRKLAEHADAPPYRPPIIEEDFEGAPHCDPARDQHTFSDDRRSGSGPKRIR